MAALSINNNAVACVNLHKILVIKSEGHYCCVVPDANKGIAVDIQKKSSHIYYGVYEENT